MKFPILETNRLILDEIVHEDSKNLFELFSDDEVVEYYDLVTLAKIEEASNLITLFKKRFEDELGIRWGIRLKENGTFVGTCGFNAWKPKMRSSSVGYDILRKYWRNGYATEALNEIIKFGFSSNLPCGPLNRIQGDTVPGNMASEAVLSKLGFKEEGLLRESSFWKDQYHDLKCFGLIKSEYSEI